MCFCKCVCPLSADDLPVVDSSIVAREGDKHAASLGFPHDLLGSYLDVRCTASEVATWYKKNP
jgi:hypothetical protein